MDPATGAIIASLIATIGPKVLGLFGGGTEDEYSQKPRLRRSQEPLYKQMIDSLMNPGAGGAFGTVADYYRDLLNPDSEAAKRMSEPELRRFREQIIPDLAEQFAGMGSGGLSSSGFRNAANTAGTDLSERLGAIRAQLAMQGAQGLAGLGQFGLGDFINNVYTPGQPGFGEAVAPGLATAATQYAGHILNQPQQQGGGNAPAPSPAPGPASPQFNASQNLPGFNLNPAKGAFGGPLSTKGKTSPYGKTAKLQLPNFAGMA